jgi:predicted negative regulator of RcsB-dependent stress response
LESKRHTGLESEGEVAIEHLTNFWDRYGRIVLGVLGALAVVGVGAFFFLRSRATQESEAAGRLAEASSLYWQGDYQRSTEAAKQVVSQYGSTWSGNDAHRILGDNAFWSGDFKTATAEYRRYVEKAPKGLLQDSGNRSLAYALESDNQYAEAAKVFDGLVGRLDRSSSGEFLIAAARCYQAINKPQDALARLHRLDSEYGETYYAQLARLKIAELEAATGTAAR